MSCRLVPAVAAAAVALAGAVAPAEANGRFPSSVSVQFRPGDPDDIYLGVTFGLLLSHDDGASFHWVCEQNVGYEGTFDPKYRIGDNGDIYATTFTGLRVSRDGGCTFSTATEGQSPKSPGYLVEMWIEALDVGSDGAVWVATAESGLPNDIFRSTDRANTFTPLGLTSTTVWWKSVAVAPSMPQRAYVSGYQVTQTGPDGGAIPPTVHLHRTDDNGQSWTMLGIAAFQLAPSPLVLIEEVSPTDPDVVFARSVRAVPPSGDKLYRSTDAGETFAEVLTTTDTVRSVVMRGDGTTVFVATQMGGVWRSTDAGATFTRIGDRPEAGCMNDRGDALFACGANWEPDFFAIGRSSDGASWSKVFRYVEMKGPLQCPAGTMQRDVCEAQLWPAIREQFGVAEEPDPPPEPEGCLSCSARGSSAGQAAAAAGLAAVVLGLLLRRRKGAS